MPRCANIQHQTSAFWGTDLLLGFPTSVKSSLGFQGLPKGHPQQRAFLKMVEKVLLKTWNVPERNKQRCSFLTFFGAVVG